MYFEDFSKKDLDSTNNIKHVIERYLIHYKWFIISVLLFFISSFVFVRTLVPRYDITASILIKENEEGKSINNLSSFENLGLFGSEDQTLENEIQIIKSRRMMSKVVRELKLNVVYSLEDSPYDKELFNEIPFVVNIDNSDISFDRINTECKIVIKSAKSFDFIGFDKKIIPDKSFGELFEADLGNDDGSVKSSIRLDLIKDNSDSYIGKTLIIKILPENLVTDFYMQKIIVEPINEKLSRVLSINMDETVVNKGVAIINNLVEQYNADGIEDKNTVSQATTDFLDFRINLISQELVAIEGTAEQFKSKNLMVGAEQGTNYYLESSSMNERQLVAENTQLQLINYMLEELEKSSNSELLPGNIGLSDIGIVNLVQDYNDQILQRNRVLKSSSIKNPIIIGIDSQLIALKNNLISSLSSLKSSSEIQINALNNQGGKISSRIASVPKNEREFKDIVREQETKNTLYLFLLQKREESILSNAVNVEKAKLIDKAYSTGKPVYPKKSILYLAAIIMGLIIPLVVIYVSDLMDTKVHDEKDISGMGIPFIGDIPATDSKKDQFIKHIDTSNIAEAFRYVRTNINFMLDSKDECKTIFVTSTQGGEGKTFTAINLASSLAISGKKTLLIGMDLRAPKVNKYLGLEELLGVTNFIKNNNLTMDEVTEKHTSIENLSLINSGSIPPNPVELLMSKRVDEMFGLAKSKYDYIIVDTAPVGMVTDTMQISKYSDLTIYVIKSNVLDKRMLHIPGKLYKEDKLRNMAFLINGTDHKRGAYGYGYGYGNAKKGSWFKTIFNKLSLKTT